MVRGQIGRIRVQGVVQFDLGAIQFAGFIEQLAILDMGGGVLSVAGERWDSGWGKRSFGFLYCSSSNSWF
jgi:hypothetical protein